MVAIEEHRIVPVLIRQTESRPYNFHARLGREQRCLNLWQLEIECIVLWQKTIYAGRSLISTLLSAPVCAGGVACPEAPPASCFRPTAASVP